MHLPTIEHGIVVGCQNKIPEMCSKGISLPWLDHPPKPAAMLATWLSHVAAMPCCSHVSILVWYPGGQRACHSS